MVSLSAVLVTIYVASDGVSARWHRSRADDALKVEDFETARAHQALYILYRPADPAGWFAAARSARMDGDMAQAEIYLSRAAKFGQAREQLDLERLLIDVQQYGWRGREAVLFAKVQAADPDSARICEVLGRSYLGDYLLIAALHYAEKWTELESRSARAWELKAQAAERLDQRAIAAEAYETALDINPYLPASRAGYGALLSARGRLAEALEQFEWAVRLQPHDKESRLGLARALDHVGRVEDAMLQIEILEVQYPMDRAVLGLAGSIALHAGQLLKAEKMLRAAAAQVSETQILEDLQHCLVRLKQPEEAQKIGERLKHAKADFGRLTELSKEVRNSLDPAPRIEAGRIMVRNGFFHEGLGWLLDAVKISPANREAHAEIAKCYEALKIPEQAALHRRLAGGH